MKPQDILIALKIQSLHDQAVETPVSLPQRLLAEETGLSLSEVNAACRRLEAVGLLAPARRKIVRAALLEFLVHGLKYVFPPAMGESSRGMPTGYAADPLKDQFLASADEMPPVWPDAQGTVRGIALKPLYKSVPMAAKKDRTLYEYLVLIDAIRGGRARERSKAIEIIQTRLR
jgi:DNA-binding transcriptional MocR family regulator